MNTNFRILVILVLLCAACSVPVKAATQTDLVEQVDEVSISFKQQLDLAIPEMLERYRVPGAAIGFVHSGQVKWVASYGVADLTTRVQVTPHTIFRVASISKPVTAWGVMHLQEHGLIDLQTPVQNYLTRWHFPPSAYDVEEVTVYRLLSHTAGTNVHGYGRTWVNEPIPSVEESLSGSAIASQAVRIIQEPGTGYMYSGGGYTVLQLMVEEVSGQSFESYMQGEILEPLGMTESSFQATQDVLSRMATAYDENMQPIAQHRFTEQAAAGLYATATDIAKFVTAGLAGADGEIAGRGILSPDTINLMYTPAEGAGGQYGLGYQTYYDGTRIAYHGGDNPGWESTFTILPDLGEGLVCLTNSDNGEGFNAEITSMWIKWLIEQYSEEN